MIIFGFGRRNREHVVSDAQRVLVNYRYFHIFWLFSLAFGSRYALATLTEAGWATKSISEAEAAELAGGRAPQPAFWAQWSLALALGVVAVIVLIAAGVHAASV